MGRLHDAVLAHWLLLWVGWREAHSSPVLQKQK